MRNAIVYNFGPAAGRERTASTMLAFIRLLKQRHECVLRHLSGEEDPRQRELRRNIQSLAFAEACLEKGELNRTQPDHPIQIAVLGPTQAGKSSVINWLLEQDLAEASPLAGFTVHPQGFAVAVEPARLAWLDAYFRPYRRCRREELSPDRYDSFLLEKTPPTAPGNPMRAAVVWDTPDFDSVDAEGYRLAVLRVAALADVTLLILSKDKYADLSVWNLVKLLAPLQQPTVVCLNKIDPGSYQELARSLREKWQSIHFDIPPAILPIPYQEAAAGLSGLPREREAILAEVDQARRLVHRDRHAGHARQLIAAHWPAWVEPVKAEHKLRAEWAELVAKAVQESLAVYRRDYLDHPRHYATFQRALAELLTLLEIPGIGNALVAVRQIVTWPLRQIVSLGRSIGNRHPDSADAAETNILRQAMAHLLVRVGESVVIRRNEGLTEQAFWREMAGAFRNSKATLLQNLDTSTRRYQQSFQPEIDQAARRLYELLRQHPAVLNGLRATRATTDAAALAVALNTGGIGVQDFIIAPAVLSLTSMLAEGALGHYMDREAAELKRRQMAAVETLFRETAEAELLRLPERLDKDRWLDISPEALRAAETLSL